jgi:glucose-6-phosphate 1-epimerase
MRADGAHPADDALVLLRNAAGDAASVSLHGAQLLSWQPAGEREQIYTSPLSRPAPGKALRGGTPVCFPQFSDRGPLPKHGIARTARWELLQPAANGGQIAEARFQLDSGMVQAAWSHEFCLVLAVRLGPRWLELQLQAANTGRASFDFTAALHTYFAVPDVREASIEGLTGLQYEDAAEGNALKQDTAPELHFAGETDRVYRDVPAPLRLRAAGVPSRRITQQGFVDAVVWNPGPMKAARLGDMPADDWLRMLCIEAAAIAQPVTIAPGRTWTGVQRVELETD